MSDDSTMALATPPKPLDTGEVRRKAIIQRLQIAVFVLAILGGVGSFGVLIVGYISDQRAVTTSVAAMRTEVSSIADDVRAVRGNYPLLEQRVTGIEQRQVQAETREGAQDRRISDIDRDLIETRTRLNAWTTPPVTAPLGRRAP